MFMNETIDNTLPARLRNKPSRLVSQTALQVHRLVSEGLAAVEAHQYHFALLAALEEFGPASQASLGRRLGMDRSDVAARVNELAEQGLIERTPDPADRRRNVVTITPAGIQQVLRVDRLLTEIQDELLAPLSPDERAELVRLLSRVLDHHRAD